MILSTFCFSNGTISAFPFLFLALHRIRTCKVVENENCVQKNTLNLVLNTTTKVSAGFEWCCLLSWEFYFQEISLRQ